MQGVKEFVSATRGRETFKMVRMPRWLFFGIFSGLIGIVFSFVDSIICHSLQMNCPWGGFTQKIDETCNAVVHYVGRTMGVRYGYMPYFPNHATDVFLSILGFTFLWLMWFTAGVLLYLGVRLVQTSIRQIGSR